MYPHNGSLKNKPMKKIVSFLLFTAVSICLLAQDAGLPPRPYTQAELNRWSQVCGWLGDAVPPAFKTYTLTHTSCTAFHWAETNKKGEALTVITKKNDPFGNLPYHEFYFSRNEDSVDAEYQSIIKQMLDAQNADGSYNQQKINLISAQNEKLNQCKTLSVTLMINQQVEVAEQYYLQTKPVKLDLGIPAFAYLYLFPGDKQILDEDGTGMGGTDALAFYKDKALIVISPKAPKVVTTKATGKQNWQEDNIKPQDNAPEISTAPIKNIVIQIKGEEKDVRTMIDLINWKMLQGLIGK
jgi:hypothetical protein